MHVDARLVAAALQQVEGQLRQLFPDGRGGLRRGARAEQVREAPAQGRLSVNHRGVSSPIAWSVEDSFPDPLPAAAANALSCSTAARAWAAKASSSRRIISPASARYASAPRDSRS